ncbi:MAG TPA: hypothetical protein VIC51_00200 [Psychromonas sp.]
MLTQWLSRPWRSNALVIRLFSILLAITVIVAFTLLVLLFPERISPPEDEVMVRRIDLQLPPPPEPPPPVQKKADTSQSDSASIDLSGFASSVELSYDSKPKINAVPLDKVEQPEFDMGVMDMRKTLSVQFPVVGVKSLDRMPQIVSSKQLSIPAELRRRGITRVETEVHIIIVETGRTYIKKIVNPAYPEMIEVIREYIENLVFTPPTQNGHPVQAEYFFHLNFNYRT